MTMKIPADLERMLKSYDATTGCIKRKCSTKAYKAAEKEINAIFQKQLQGLKDTLNANKIDGETYLEQFKQLMAEKISAMKKHEHVIAFYECGLKKCGKEVTKFRDVMVNIVQTDIAKAKVFIRENKKDASKQMAVQFRQEALERDKKHLAMLKKEMSPALMIDVFNT